MQTASDTDASDSTVLDIKFDIAVHLLEDSKERLRQRRMDIENLRLLLSLPYDPEKPATITFRETLDDPD